MMTKMYLFNVSWLC